MSTMGTTTRLSIVEVNDAELDLLDASAVGDLRRLRRDTRQADHRGFGPGEHAAARAVPAMRLQLDRTMSMSALVTP